MFSSAQSVDDEFALNSILLQIQIRSTSYVRFIVMMNHNLTSFRNETDVPSSLDDYNVHRCDTDVSLFVRLWIRFHRSVRYSSSPPLFSAFTMIGVI